MRQLVAMLQPTGRRQGPGKAPATSGEVVLVQDSNSFFAYEPILKALQATTDLPLAHHLLPALASQAAAAAASKLEEVERTPSVFSIFKQAFRAPAAAPQRAAAATPVDVPAYLAAGNVRYDLTILLDRGRMELLSEAERFRYVGSAECRCALGAVFNRFNPVQSKAKRRLGHHLLAVFQIWDFLAFSGKRSCVTKSVLAPGGGCLPTYSTSCLYVPWQASTSVCVTLIDTLLMCCACIASHLTTNWRGFMADWLQTAMCPT
jgi:hypothetical protein